MIHAVYIIISDWDSVIRGFCYKSAKHSKAAFVVSMVIVTDVLQGRGCGKDEMEEKEERWSGRCA